MSFGLYGPKIAWVVRSKTQKVQSKTARTVKCTTPKKYCPTIRLMPSEMYLHMPRTNRISLLMSLRHPNVPLDFTWEDDVPEIADALHLLACTTVHLAP